MRNETDYPFFSTFESTDTRPHWSLVIFFAVILRRRLRTSPPRQRAEAEIASALSGGDTLPAWNAVWDLVQSSDAHGKREVLGTLKSYVESSASRESEASRNSVAQAQEFGEAIEHRLNNPNQHCVLPSRELRKQHDADRFRSSQDAMRKIGVRPGEGLPMWAIYMTRRNKRIWG